MDTKLKNSYKKRIFIAAAGLLILTIVTMCLFPIINQDAKCRLEAKQVDIERKPEINAELLEELYEGCYVLYLESMQRQGIQTADEVFLEASYPGTDDEKANYIQELKEYANGAIEARSVEFESYRSQIDYCILFEDGECEKNTSQPLEQIGNLSKEEEKLLTEHYNNYFMLHFDENEIFTVEPIYSGNAEEDALIKLLGQFDRSDFWGSVEEEYEEYGISCKLKRPKNFNVIFAVPKTSIYQMVQADYTDGADYWTKMNIYREAGAEWLYVGMLGLIVGLVFLLTSKRIWKDTVTMNRPGKWYLMEAAIFGFICVLCFNNSFIGMIWGYDMQLPYDEIWQGVANGNSFEVIGHLLGMAFAISFIYVSWYLSIRFIRPVFALGFKEYVRQYSFFYQIFPWIKKQWEKFRHEMEHIDFQKGATKTIVKIVGINFIVLSVCSMMWFFGVVALVVYSVVLFCLIDNYYKKIEFHYRALLRGVNKIAEGDLETEITEDLGVFEPFKGELGKIRQGFKNAVDEEVKSQRMKTELITNVSHDLKTPLTAITTYVELLKKEDITEEERRSYIDTLEKKSLRLKVLIEDLFEVSKATSNNITFDYMDVDVVKLMKQVAIEHEDKFMQAGLTLRWNVPEEKTILRLDNQKTYRIFENLFVNIQKYAMPNSRVYVDVKKIAEETKDFGAQVMTADAGQSIKKEGIVEITIKNMSAHELNLAAEEITERFVRGDASRNTEGSGLGLAIAKSFTEGQGGSFKVEVDGDLFKVVIRWKCDMI